VRFAKTHQVISFTAEASPSIATIDLAHLVFHVQFAEALHAVARAAEDWFRVAAIDLAPLARQGDVALRLVRPAEAPHTFLSQPSDWHRLVLTLT